MGGEQIFWRQSADRCQSIFCLNNTPDTAQTMPLSLIGTDKWKGLISDGIFEDILGSVTLEPYQTL